MPGEEDDVFRALGLMACLIAIETVGVLARKEVLTPLEAREIFDKSQVSLEMRVAQLGPSPAAAFDLARGYLEDALAALSQPRRPL